MANVARFYTEIMDDRARDLADVLNILEDVGASYALIGGLAVGYHGHPRATIDVDMLVPGRFLKRIADTARAHGYAAKTFLPDSVRIYPPSGGDRPVIDEIADLVSSDANPVMRAAFREVETAEVLGETVSIVNLGALIALKFHAAVSPTREIEDKYQDVADIGHVIKAGFGPTDQEIAHRIASLTYPGAGDDFDVFIDDLRHGRSVRF